MNILSNLKMGTFDLHIHTTSSDGALTPTQIVDKAKKIGLKTIAITDHDTLSGIEEAKKRAELYNITVIPGVEVSTRWKGKSVDILGYNIERIEFLHTFLEEYRLDRVNRAYKIIEKFCNIDMEITIEDVKEFSKDGVIARPHIAKAIVKKGYVNTLQEVFDLYLADGKPCEVEKKELLLPEGIKVIKEAGGVAVLAHPVYLRSLETIKEIIEEGIDGIEVWHRSHSRNDVKQFINLAKKNKLIVTGGSDFHVEEHNLGYFMK